jgi:hypothetical protein
MDEETIKKFRALAEGYHSVENLVFSVSPEMSYPRPEWVAQDPTFWGRKPARAASTQGAGPGS